ncbi:putative DNA-methyltransferase [Gracilibacillus halophilus YIM-C55.5]|uniref:Putative DNA-methyltransferase n=1 Tax=Gracilibacillus halophilus YIM-C55.5 TaxID=1308866 RepID=N4WV08_9BACI|nr:putative DNA-methyltransferase [Gracilibacillus halophilus YIM-C55.5]
MDVEHVFHQVDQTTEQLQNELEETYLDSLILVLQYLNNSEDLSQVPQGSQSKLEDLANVFDQENMENEDVRKIIQLAILKAMKGSTQHQHMITPDSVAMFIGYFIEKLTSKQKQLTLFDPAIGTGNLLTATMHQLQADVTAYGSEVDQTLIRLAVESANLQQTPIELFHQDSLTPFLLDPVDVVVSDLPVGYYPNDQQARQYELQAPEGHSYAHHLFIEQSLTYTKPGGYAIFLVPNFLFTSDQSDQLKRYITKHAHILSFLQLPLSLFTSEKQAKSIFIVQKQGDQTKAPKQTLMAQLPSFKEVQATQKVLAQIDQWFHEYMTE